MMQQKQACKVEDRVKDNSSEMIVVSNRQEQAVQS